MENEWKGWDFLKLKLGARAATYKNDRYQFRKVDFRASASFEIGEGTIKLAYDEMNQPFHLLNSTGSGSPNEV